jgi:hypothetical protein
MAKKHKEKINSVFVAGAFVVVLLLVISAYSIGVKNSEDVLFKEFGINEDNLGGMAYSAIQKNCAVDTNEVVVVNEDCISRTDCAPEGVCLKDVGKCAYFLD